MMTTTAYNKYCIWEHSQTVHELYARRCRKEAEEMTSHKQAVALIKPFIEQGDSVLDVGCGSGYFYHSLVNQNLSAEYWGIDSSETLIELGKKYMEPAGLLPERLKVLRIEDMDGTYDHVVCINVLSNIDNYHRPLERMLHMARKTVVFRESLSDHNDYAYVKDKYLDSDVDLKVHVNTYSIEEVKDFVRSYGFDVEEFTDEYTGGKPEMVIDYPHYWKFIRATRKV